MVKRFRPIKLGVGGARGGGSLYGKELTAQLAPQLRALEDEFRRFAQHMTDETAQVCIEALQPTMNKSLEQVPVDTRRLYNSHYLEARRFRGNVVVEMGYARNGNPDYAILVHEKLEFRHAEPTKAKFLEDPINEDIGEIKSRLIAGLKTASGT